MQREEDLGEGVEMRGREEDLEGGSRGREWTGSRRREERDDGV